MLEKIKLLYALDILPIEKYTIKANNETINHIQKQIKNIENKNIKNVVSNICGIPVLIDLDVPTGYIMLIADGDIKATIKVMKEAEQWS